MWSLVMPKYPTKKTGTFPLKLKQCHQKHHHLTFCWKNYTVAYSSVFITQLTAIHRTEIHASCCNISKINKQLHPREAKHVLKTNLQQHFSYKYRKHLSLSFTPNTHAQQCSNITDTTQQRNKRSAKTVETECRTCCSS